LYVAGLFIAMALVLGSVLATQILAQDATPLTDQPVTVAGSELTWTGDWTYTTGTSALVAEQVTFSQTDLEKQVLTVLSYGLLTSEAGAEGSTAVDAFAESFLEDGGATDVNQVRTGQLDDGTVWAVYTANASEDAGITTFGDAGLATLVTAAPGDSGLVVTSLTTNSPLLGDAITKVQGDFTVDGSGQLFPGIDAALVTADLPTGDISVTGVEPGSTPPGSPEAELVASPGATPLTGPEATLAAIQDGESTPAS
jgi:enamine deaminase RidA (YjgF/YER057c/UK114 family)